MSVRLPCDNCDALDVLLPVTEYGDDEEREVSWCPACVADAMVEVADAEDIADPPTSQDAS